jgi:Rrf2 family protein
MRFSKKSDYALRALCYLSGQADSKPVSMRTIAQDNDIPYRFLQQIALDLKANGWISTVPGREGGVVLARPPHAITVGEVVRYFDGVLAPIGCVSTTHYTACSQETSCRFRRLLLEVRNYTAALLDRTTLSDLLLDDVVPTLELPGCINIEAVETDHRR